MKYRWQTLLLIGILTGIFLTGNVSALAAESSGEGGTESIEEDIIQADETESDEEDSVQSEETGSYEAASASGRLKTGLEWTLKNGTLSFSAGGDGKWVIPDCKADGSDIPWKKYLKSIKLIDFPMNSREVSIGSYAFKGCTALKEVWLDDENVDYVGQGAFQNCTAIKAVVWEIGVNIEPDTFSGCSSLDTFTSDEYLTAIGDRAFKGCKALKTLDINTYDLCSIGQEAFSGCKALKDFYLECAIPEIGKKAFDNRESLTVYVPSQYITDYAQLKKDYSQIKLGTNWEASFPLMKECQTTNTGIRVRWEAISGASSYVICRAADNGEAVMSGWEEIDSIDSDSKTGTALEYIDTNVEAGSSYWYSVQAVNEDTGLLSAWGVSGDMEWAINCAAPELTSVKAVDQGIKLTWNKVKGADGYRLYYRTGDTWQLIGDVRGSKDSYVWNGAEKGHHYEFTIRCLSDYLAAPVSGSKSPAGELSY